MNSLILGLAVFFGVHCISMVASGWRNRAWQGTYSIAALAGLYPLVAGALWLTANPVIAQEYQPYPSPKITPEQWANYAEEVRQLHGDSLGVFKDKQLFAFSDLRARTFWIFTMKDHPAHPAWITRQMYDEGGVVRIRQIGYFAGSEEAFATLFREYQERNEQLKEEVERRNQ